MFRGARNASFNAVHNYIQKIFAVDTTGYLGSAMREYIVNNFLTGLENAGVPKDVLWPPIRRVASRGNGVPTEQTVKDDLWLPTV
ncbi:MAG: hypothetical protein Ta2F_12920 [Termitinemataceae bacterium]|nr:MAG: hypothetical protein Ta2F_12920 [Termitinemataceae bacterium]